MRRVRACEEPRCLAAHGFVDDESEQGATDPLAAGGSRNRYASALRAVRVPDRAAAAHIGHRGRAPRFVLGGYSKARVVRGHGFPAPPLLRVALLHRAVPGVALGDHGFAVAILEWTRAVPVWEDRRESIRIERDHPRDDTAGFQGVKSPARHRSVMRRTPF